MLRKDELNYSMHVLGGEGNPWFIQNRKTRMMTDLCEPVMGIKEKGKNYLDDILGPGTNELEQFMNK